MYLQRNWSNQKHCKYIQKYLSLKTRAYNLPWRPLGFSCSCWAGFRLVHGLTFLLSSFNEFTQLENKRQRKYFLELMRAKKNTAESRHGLTENVWSGWACCCFYYQTAFSISVRAGKNLVIINRNEFWLIVITRYYHLFV